MPEFTQEEQRRLETMGINPDTVSQPEPPPEPEPPTEQEQPAAEPAPVDIPTRTQELEAQAAEAERLASLEGAQTLSPEEIQYQASQIPVAKKEAESARAKISQLQNLQEQEQALANTETKVQSGEIPLESISITTTKDGQEVKLTGQEAIDVYRQNVESYRKSVSGIVSKDISSYINVSSDGSYIVNIPMALQAGIPESVLLSVTTPELIEQAKQDVQQGVTSWEPVTREAVAAEAFVSQQFKKRNVELPDGQYISKVDLENIKTTDIEAYNALIDGGLEKANKLYEQRFVETLSPDLQQAYSQVGIDNLKTYLNDNYVVLKDGSYIERKELENIKTENEYLYNLIMSDGLSKANEYIDNQTIALDKIKAEAPDSIASDGGIYLAIALQSGVDEQTLIDAGFNSESVQEAKKWVVAPLDERVNEAAKLVFGKDYTQLNSLQQMMAMEQADNYRLFTRETMPSGIATAIGMIPITGTIYFWDEMSTGERALSIGLDTLALFGGYILPKVIGIPAKGLIKAFTKTGLGDDTVRFLNKQYKYIYNAIKGTDKELANATRNIIKVQAQYADDLIKAEALNTAIKETDDLIKVLQGSGVSETTSRFQALDDLLTQNKTSLAKLQARITQNSAKLRNAQDIWVNANRSAELQNISTRATALRQAITQARQAGDTNKLLRLVNEANKLENAEDAIRVFWSQQDIVEYTNNIIKSLTKIPDEQILKTLSEELKTAQSLLRNAQLKYPGQVDKWIDLLNNVDRINANIRVAEAGSVTQMSFKLAAVRDNIKQLKRLLAQMNITAKTTGTSPLIDDIERMIKTSEKLERELSGKLRTALNDMERLYPETGGGTATKTRVLTPVTPLGETATRGSLGIAGRLAGVGISSSLRGAGLTGGSRIKTEVLPEIVTTIRSIPLPQIKVSPTTVQSPFTTTSPEISPVTIDKPIEIIKLIEAIEPISAPSISPSGEISVEPSVRPLSSTGVSLEQAPEPLIQPEPLAQPAAQPSPVTSTAPVETAISMMSPGYRIVLPYSITETSEGKKAIIPDGSVAYFNGLFWKYIPPPWNQPKPITLPKGVVPIGAKTGGGNSPYTTVQMIGEPKSKVPERISIDDGIVDIFITEYGKNITFTGNGEDTDVGTSLASPTVGMSLNSSYKKVTRKPRKKKRDTFSDITSLRGMKW